MTRAAFFRTELVQALLQRAATAAAVPLSLHYVSGTREGIRVAGIGQCAACKHVGSLDEGAAACRASREEALPLVLAQDKATPFLCHMGFACVSIRALAEEGYVLTFGPYCPSETPQTLELDARRGLAELGEEYAADEGLPFGLDDVRLVPSDALPTLAEWTVEQLRSLVGQEEAPVSVEQAPDPLDEDAPVGSRKPGRRATADPFNAGLIASALASNDHGTARELVVAALAETRGARRRGPTVSRARAIALSAAVVEAAGVAGLDIAPVEKAWPDLLWLLENAENDGHLANAIMDTLSILKRRERRVRRLPEGMEALAQLVAGRLTEGITLNEVAQVLGQTPSAITHRLQRKFGMSFSEYVGRLRVDRSKELLRRTKLSIREVSKRVGIADPSNLGRLFRKFEGVSPGDYRRKYGKK